MPRCLSCGNTTSFGSSQFPPAAPTANGPISSLMADFNDDNSINQMSTLGPSIDEAQEAWEAPRSYFDTCYVCGSQKIGWD